MKRVDDDIGLGLEVNSCTISQGSSVLMPPYNIIFSKPQIGNQKCYNYLLVIAPGILGMIPATSLGGERAYQKWHGGLMTGIEKNHLLISFNRIYFT